VFVVVAAVFFSDGNCPAGGSLVCRGPFRGFDHLSDHIAEASNDSGSRSRVTLVTTGSN
jgi:hypothetical protein